MNSSPPWRAMVSSSRTHSESRRDTWRSSSSPTSWPRVSLMFLKLSRSMNSTATLRPARSARAMERARRS